jgi:hypothetical protein
LRRGAGSQKIVPAQKKGDEMPHWNGVVPTGGTPQILKKCKGDPNCCRAAIISDAPPGVNLRAISWKDGKDDAVVTLEGDEAAVLAYFKDKLGIAAPEGPLLTAGERKAQRP